MAVFLTGRTGLHAVSPVGLGSSYANELALSHSLSMAGNFVRTDLQQTFESATQKIAIRKVNNVAFLSFS